MNRLNKLRLAALSTAATLGGAAQAAAITLPAEITDAEASVAVIGAGVFAIMVGIKVYKWLRRAL